MKALTDYTWLADENIHPKWIEAASIYTTVFSVHELGLAGQSDSALMSMAYKNEYVIFTQDSDFGKLAFLEKHPFTGIVYLRPGHFNAAIHLTSLNAIVQQQLRPTPPFIIVVSNKMEKISIRVKTIIA